MSNNIVRVAGLHALGCSSFQDAIEANGVIITDPSKTRGIVLAGELMRYALAEGTFSGIRAAMLRLAADPTMTPAKHFRSADDIVDSRWVSTPNDSSDDKFETDLKTMTEMFVLPNNLYTGMGVFGIVNGPFVETLDVRNVYLPMNLRGVNANPLPISMADGEPITGLPNTAMVKHPGELFFAGFMPVFADQSIEEVLDSPYKLVDQAPSIARSVMKDRIDDAYKQTRDTLVAKLDNRSPYLMVPFVRLGTFHGFSFPSRPFAHSVQSVRFGENLILPMLVNGPKGDINSDVQPANLGDLSYEKLIGTGLIGDSNMYTPRNVSFKELFENELYRTSASVFYDAKSAIYTPPVDDPGVPAGTALGGYFSSLEEQKLKMAPSEINILDPNNVMFLHAVMSSAVDEKTSLQDTLNWLSPPVSYLGDGVYLAVPPTLEQLIDRCYESMKAKPGL